MKKEKYTDCLNAEAERYSNEEAARMWTEENRTFREIAEEVFKAGARWYERCIKKGASRGVAEVKYIRVPEQLEAFIPQYEVSIFITEYLTKDELKMLYNQKKDGYIVIKLS